MASKCIVIILVAVCALQVANSSGITDVLEAVNATINKTATEVEEEIENFYSEAQNLTSAIGSEITSGASSATSAVSSAISKAEELGVDIETCVSDAESGINSVVSDSEAGIGSCLSNSSIVLEPDLKEIENDVKLAENLTSQAVSNYISCKVLDFVCQAGVVESAEAQGAALAAQVTEHAALIATDLASVKIAFDTCSAEVTSTGISNATVIYEQEASCIAEKISEDASP